MKSFYDKFFEVLKDNKDEFILFNVNIFGLGYKDPHKFADVLFTSGCTVALIITSI